MESEQKWRLTGEGDGHYIQAHPRGVGMRDHLVCARCTEWGRGHSPFSPAVVQCARRPWGAGGGVCRTSEGRSVLSTMDRMDPIDPIDPIDRNDTPGISIFEMVWPPVRRYRVSCAEGMRAPESTDHYWAEFAWRAGHFAASDYDANGNRWTAVQRFDTREGTNGNGDRWTEYSAVAQADADGALSVGLKIGSLASGCPPVAWVRCWCGRCRPASCACRGGIGDEMK